MRGEQNQMKRRDTRQAGRHRARGVRGWVDPVVAKAVARALVREGARAWRNREHWWPPVGDWLVEVWHPVWHLVEWVLGHGRC